jgi:CreA protein
MKRLAIPSCNAIAQCTASAALIEGSPKNSTSSVPIMPWGQNDQIQKCADFLEK